MDFGWVDNVNQIDFSFPSEVPHTKERLAAWKTNEPSKWRIGCPIWANPAWHGKVYPRYAKSDAYLSWYAKQFNTVELNSTHYGIPSPETTERWVKTVGDDFLFCPKILQEISHKLRLKNVEKRLILWEEFLIRLGTKAGVSFLQLPPDFGVQEIKSLENFLKLYPNQHRLSVEFRHESWFKTTEGFDLLHQYKVGSVITDVAGRRDVLHQHISAPFVLIRFIGNDLHSTDYDRINDWIHRLITWAETGLPEVYFFCHEPNNNYAPDLAAYLRQELDKKGIKTDYFQPLPKENTLFDN